MTRSLKIFWVLLATVGFMGFMGSNAVLMASHATHFVSDKGPHLPQNESGCTTCHAAGNLQCGEDGPLFADSTPEEPRYLANTTVCDPCHSPGGTFPGANGLDDPDIGAKANWDGGVYEADGTTLKSGKQKWCATCHDDDPANSKVDGSGIAAPNVIGDSGQVYGYYVSGHGRLDVLPMSDINLECEECHDLTGTHIDGEHRTYSASSDNYQQGYRLSTSMIVPRPLENDGAFELCTSSCHNYDDLIGDASNFRSAFMEIDDPCTSPQQNWHGFHLVEDTTYYCGDTDFDGQRDSWVTCILCHNVHGSPMDIGAGSDIQVDDFESYTDNTSIRGTWTPGWDASWAYLASGYGPDGSKCMAMKVTWDQHSAGAAYEWRALAPIDLTDMDYISFHVNVYNVAAFQGIKVGLRRNQDGIWTEAAHSTSELELESGVWKLVSFPKEHFDSDFGEVNGLSLVAYENYPGQSYATWILFDDIRCVLHGTTDYHANPVMIRHGELISTPGTNDKVPAFDFKWYAGNCIEPGQPAVSVDASRWGRMLTGNSVVSLSVNDVCFGCHNIQRPGLEYGEIQYYREPLE